MTYLQDRNLIGLFLQDSYSPPRAFLQIPTDGIIVHYYCVDVVVVILVNIFETLGTFTMEDLLI